MNTTPPAKTHRKTYLFQFLFMSPGVCSVHVVYVSCDSSEAVDMVGPRNTQPHHFFSSPNQKVGV
ncbi:hypothetical protein K440DRAFT_608829, partial [Wilcoxina mikolae CBS 423.85]